MKNNKRNIIIGIILGVLLIAGSICAVTLILKNENAFNMNEKKYMINNKSSLKSISVVNDANVFGRDGTGIYYDFLDKLEKETDLSFNIVTSSVQIDQTGLALTKGNYLPENSKLLYTDHFVLVGKKHVAISGLDKISGTIGYLSKDSIEGIFVIFKKNCRFLQKKCMAEYRFWPNAILTHCFVYAFLASKIWYAAFS